MTCAVSAAVREGAQAVICASTGNTAASAAAYAARGGLTGVVIVPEGKIATGKLAQALMHGARVIALRGNFDEALELVRELAASTRSRSSTRQPVPARGAEDGVVRDPRGDRRDRRALHPGRQRGQHHRVLEGLPGDGRARPRMHGFQAAGAAPLVTGQRVEHPETVASAIRIGNPARWEEAMTAMRDSRGGVERRDRRADPRRLPLPRRPRGRLLRAGQRRVASPACSCTAPEGAERIVCVLTGHGLKDPQTALEQAGTVVPCEPELAAVEQAIYG